MAYVITMPKLGLTMSKGTVVQWNKQEGDWIEEGDEVCEIETDKISNVIESPISGYLRLILAQEMEEVEVKGPLGILGELNEDISIWNKANVESPITVASEEVVEKSENKEMKVEDVIQQEQKSESVLATPAAKAFAKEHIISLEDVLGTGPDHRIQERDVIQHYNSHSPSRELSIAEQNFAVIKVENRNLEEIQDRREPLRGIRKAISRNMTNSWQTVPHVTLHKKVDVTKLVNFNQQFIKSTFIDQKITITHQLVKACATILGKLKYVNTSLIDNEIVYHHNINIGVAVATSQGLTVPVVKNANQKGIQQISEEIVQFGIAAKEEKLSIDDLSGGTFTISNLGMYKIDYFTPIINPPEAAILGVGRIDQENDKDVVHLSLSFDHRIIDGAGAAIFLQELEEILNQPLKLFI